MKKRANGFTLIELMVVVAIVAILAALAMPSFRTMLLKRSVQSAVVSLAEDLRYARSEALRRSVAVSVCSLAANSTDTCSVGAASWANGWMVFAETTTPNPNLGVRDAAEDIIRVQQPPANIASIQGPIPANDRLLFTYQATGFAKTADQTFIFTPSGTVPAGTTRLVCISIAGRVSVREEGATGCQS